MQQETYSKSGRIASNTILLFLRMFVITIINLYAVRIVLKGLGDVDYGIFNTVAGVITVSAFISGVLSVSMQRFYSYAIGEGTFDKLKEIFSASIHIILILVVVVVLLFETVGLWFVDTQLTIPAERMDAMLTIYHFALCAFVFSLIQIPFMAAVFANEDMGIYAAISIVECLLKLLAAFLILQVTNDGLVFYGRTIMLIAIFVACLYFMVCKIRYKEYHYVRIQDKSLYRKLLSFSGWTLFGSIANTSIIQGSTILLNVFFGPIVNAAFAIALQINNAFIALGNTMVLSFRPAMIKAYAEKQHDFLNKLFSICNKFLLYTLLAIAIPIFSEMETILNLWLDHVTENTVLFSRLIIIYIVCMAQSNPITIIVQASGRLKSYHLPVESVTIASLPLSYLFFVFGLPSWFVFVSIISTCLIAHVVRLWCLKHMFDFSITRYCRTLLLPGAIVVLVSVAFVLLIHYYIPTEYYRLIILLLAIPSIVAGLVYLIGVDSQERTIVRQSFNTIIKHKLCHKP